MTQLEVVQQLIDVNKILKETIIVFNDRITELEKENERRKKQVRLLLDAYSEIQIKEIEKPL